METGRTYSFETIFSVEGAFDFPAEVGLNFRAESGDRIQPLLCAPNIKRKKRQVRIFVRNDTDIDHIEDR